MQLMLMFSHYSPPRYQKCPHTSSAEEVHGSSADQHPWDAIVALVVLAGSPVVDTGYAVVDPFVQATGLWMIHRGTMELHCKALGNFSPEVNS